MTRSERDHQETVDGHSRLVRFFQVVGHVSVCDGVDVTLAALTGAKLPVIRALFRLGVLSTANDRTIVVMAAAL